MSLWIHQHAPQTWTERELRAWLWRQPDTAIVGCYLWWWNDQHGVIETWLTARHQQPCEVDGTTITIAQRIYPLPRWMCELIAREDDLGLLPGVPISAQQYRSLIQRKGAVQTATTVNYGQAKDAHRRDQRLFS